jgi:hypothetical protein
LNILSLCDFTGNMVKDWLEAGHTATLVDIQHPLGITKAGNLTKVGASILDWEPDQKYDVVFSFPPCTHLAGSGARWWKQKGPQALKEALELVDRCFTLSKQLSDNWMLENPVGRLSTYRGQPNYRFNPNEYGGYLNPEGDHYTKKTCLWAGTAFVMPPKKIVPPFEGSKMHLMSSKQKNERSETPRGFAKAVYLYNSRKVLV